MAYPGNPELSSQAQERVMTAFRQVVSKLQEGQREEALIGLEFVLRLDPAYTPAINLRQQLRSGAEEIDLSDIIAQLQAPTTDAINELLVEAVECFNTRNFVDAKEKVQQVLIELPGHTDARQLLNQVDEALKVEHQVGQFLAQAREALAGGDPQEAANFVMMAQALDPHHSGIATTLKEIHDTGGVVPQQPAPAATPEATAGAPPADAPSFETEEGDFAVQFDQVAAGPAASPDFEPAAAEPLEEDDSLFESAQTGHFDPVEAPPEAAPPIDVEPPPAAADPPPPIPDPPSVPREPQPEPPPPPPGDDLSDLFEAEPEELPAPAGARPTESSRGEVAAQVDLLIQKGESALEMGDHLGAIDAWSRVFLLDPSHPEIGQRVALAKQRQAESQQQTAQLVLQAQDASIGGEEAKALDLIAQILKIQPTHQEAMALKAQLIGAAPEAPSQTAGASAAGDGHQMPDLEEDLFAEDFSAATGAPAAPQVESLDADALPPAAPSASVVDKLRALPLKTIALAAAALVLVVVAGWTAKSLFSGSGGAADADVYEVARQADQLIRAGQVDEGCGMVTGYPASNPADQLVLKRIQDKCQQLLAPATPTPVPASVIRATQARDENRWLAAYLLAMKGLESHRGDNTLVEIKTAVEARDARTAILYAALAKKDYPAASGTAADLLSQFPDQEILRCVLDSSLYNSSLEQLRVYNLTGAESHLRRLAQRRPDDEDVLRILEFISNYKARPVDMRLKVFIRSLQERDPYMCPEVIT